MSSARRCRRGATTAVLAFTLNGQGGGARYLPEVYDHYDNSAFTREGALKSAYAERTARILARADELGMVVIVGMFYWKHTLKMQGEVAIWRAMRETMDFLRETGRRNILVEIANETGHAIRLRDVPHRARSRGGGYAQGRVSRIPHLHQPGRDGGGAGARNAFCVAHPQRGLSSCRTAMATRQRG